MHAILDNLHDQIAILDETGTIIETNQSWERQQPETIGLNFLQFYEREDLQPETQKLRQEIQTIITGEKSTFTWIFTRGNVKLAMQISAFANQNNAKLLVSLRDITKLDTADLPEEHLEEIDQLRETNIALNSLLKSREQDRAILEGTIANNVKQLIMPYVERLETEPLSTKQQTFVTIIKGYLDNLISPFLHRMSTINQHLTPQELKIASLIRQGRSTKEIGAALNLTVNGVGFHRKSIRTKLGLTGSGKNLRSQLMALH